MVKSIVAPKVWWLVWLGTSSSQIPSVIFCAANRVATWAEPHSSIDGNKHVTSHFSGFRSRFGIHIWYPRHSFCDMVMLPTDTHMCHKVACWSHRAERVVERWHHASPYSIFWGISNLSRVDVILTGKHMVPCIVRQVSDWHLKRIKRYITKQKHFKSDDANEQTSCYICKWNINTFWCFNWSLDIKRTI